MTTNERLIKIAENEQKVYEAGQKSEHDRFWDAYIGKDGDIITSVSMFSGYRWTDDIYKPTHTIKSNAFSGMYQNTSLADTKVTLDLSYGNGTDVFRNASKLRNIEKIIVDSGNAFSNWFYNCTALEEISFEGVIGNSLDIHWSTKLSMGSLSSIVGALSKTVTGQTLTLPTTARATYDNATIGGAWDNLVSQYPNWSFAYA